MAPSPKKGGRCNLSNTTASSWSASSSYTRTIFSLSAVRIGAFHEAAGWTGTTWNPTNRKSTKRLRNSPSAQVSITVLIHVTVSTRDDMRVLPPGMYVVTRTRVVSGITSISMWSVSTIKGAATIMFCIKVGPHHTCTCMKKPSWHVTKGRPRSSPLSQACHCRPWRPVGNKGARKSPSTTTLTAIGRTVGKENSSWPKTTSMSPCGRSPKERKAQKSTRM